MNQVLEYSLNNFWKSLGINPSDTVLVHSNIKPLLRNFLKKKIRIYPEDILDSLLNYITNEGNLLFPAFSFKSINNKSFSINDTVSEMGSLSEVARLHSDSKRTKHPVYSFSSFGPITNDLLKIENKTAYGIDSPFQKLREIDAKILVIDLSENTSMTFYHHVEEILGVDYRYLKDFTFEYFDNFSNNLGLCNYSIYVRDLEAGVITNVDPMGEKLNSEGFYIHNSYMPEIKARIISSKALFSETNKVIKTGRAQGLLYKIKK